MIYNVNNYLKKILCPYSISPYIVVYFPIHYSTCMSYSVVYASPECATFTKLYVYMHCFPIHCIALWFGCKKTSAIYTWYRVSHNDIPEEFCVMSDIYKFYVYALYCTLFTASGIERMSAISVWYIAAIMTNMRWVLSSYT